MPPQHNGLRVPRPKKKPARESGLKKSPRAWLDRRFLAGGTSLETDADTVGKAPSAENRGGTRRPVDSTQLFANSLARLQSDLLICWPWFRPDTGRVQLRRMPMPAV